MGKFLISVASANRPGNKNMWDATCPAATGTTAEQQKEKRLIRMGKVNPLQAKPQSPLAEPTYLIKVSYFTSVTQSPAFYVICHDSNDSKRKFMPGYKALASSIAFSATCASGPVSAAHSANPDTQNASALA